MEKVKDFTNTWCEADDTTYTALVNLGINQVVLIDIYKDDYVYEIAKNRKGIWTHYVVSRVSVKNLSEIELVKDTFYFTNSIISFTGDIQHFYERGDDLIVLPKDIDKSLIKYGKQYKITLEEIK